jgi:hypothetical protein
MTVSPLRMTSRAWVAGSRVAMHNNTGAILRKIWKPLLTR